MHSVDCDPVMSVIKGEGTKGVGLFLRLQASKIELYGN